MKLYVGNISFKTTSEQLRAHFAQVGEVVTADVVFDRVRDRSKGFGFVTMASTDEARAAIEKFNELEFMGRPLQVTEARSKGPIGVGQTARR